MCVHVTVSYAVVLAVTRGVFSRLMSSGSKFVMEGVKNLVIRSQSLPVTRMVEQLVEQKASKVTCVQPMQEHTQFITICCIPFLGNGRLLLL